MTDARKNAVTKTSIVMVCHKCGYTWNYDGKSRKYACCYKCHARSRIPEYLGGVPVRPRSGGHDGALIVVKRKKNMLATRQTTVLGNIYQHELNLKSDPERLKPEFMICMVSDGCSKNIRERVLNNPSFKN